MMHSLLLLDAAPGDPGPLLLVRLFGDVDPPDAAALERCARAALRAGAVHLDLSDLAFAGAWFASWLLDTAARLADVGVPLSLRAPGRRVARLLARLDLADRFALAEEDLLGAACTYASDR